MSIPVSDTLVDIKRSSTEDGYDERTPYYVHRNIRAVIDEPSPGPTATHSPEGLLAGTTRRITCDPVDLRVGDIVIDLSTGREYVCSMADHGPRLIAHTTGMLSDIQYRQR